MLREPDLCKDVLPVAFVNKFNTADMKLKKLSEKTWDTIAFEVNSTETSKLTRSL
jgi:hypothetical protein